MRVRLTAQTKASTLYRQPPRMIHSRLAARLRARESASSWAWASMRSVMTATMPERASSNVNPVLSNNRARPII